MIRLNYEEYSLISKEAIQFERARLNTYTQHLQNEVAGGGYDSDESSINLPFDAAMIERVKQVGAKYKTSELKYIFVVGIGGSELGTKAIYSAMKGRLDFLREGEFHTPKLVFVDTVSSEMISEIESMIKDDNSLNHKDEMLVLLISKSGGTTEVITNYEILAQSFSDYFGSISDRTIVITDQDSKLWNAADERQLEKLIIPKKVGGRYSVFSPVGLLPLFLVGIDIEKILEGARDFIDTNIVENTISEDLAESDDLAQSQTQQRQNISLDSAILAYLQYKNGKNINNTFLFDPKMEDVGKWYRQLMGESIGKEYDIEGNKVNIGITPIVSIGSNDLHSMVQLYLGGPDDKFTNFVVRSSILDEDEYKAEVNSETNTMREKKVIEEVTLGELVNGIKDKSMEEVMSAIYVGVRTAYKKNGTSFVEVILDEINEYSIGEFIQFKMIEMMYLAKLLNLNAFDQPAVEKYKEETREILN